MSYRLWIQAQSRLCLRIHNLLPIIRKGMDLIDSCQLHQAHSCKVTIVIVHKMVALHKQGLAGGVVPVAGASASRAPEARAQEARVASLNVVGVAE